MSAYATGRGIVVGVDGSPASTAAVLWAARDAALHKVSLTIAHAVEPIPPASGIWGEVPAPDGYGQWRESEAKRVIDDALHVVETVHPRSVRRPFVVSWSTAPLCLSWLTSRVVPTCWWSAAEGRGWRRRLHVYSEKHRFALELRTNLIVLFALAALALTTQVSIMLAGFAVGLVVSAVGEPRRLARQLFGITEGFFSPLFFVWLGASLQVRDLGSHPKLILLGVGLGLGAVLAHGAGRLLGQPLTFAVLSAAQLGVPVAAATIGTQEHLLAPGEPAALIFGALLTIAATSIAGRLAARDQVATQPDKPAETDTHGT